MTPIINQRLSSAFFLHSSSVNTLAAGDGPDGFVMTRDGTEMILYTMSDRNVYSIPYINTTNKINLGIGLSLMWCPLKGRPKPPLLFALLDKLAGRCCPHDLRGIQQSSFDRFLGAVARERSYNGISRLLLVALDVESLFRAV